MTSRSILADLLRVLVQEWGHKEVESALAELSGLPRRSRLDWNTAGRKAVRKGTRRPRLLASEQVAKAQLPEAQKGIMQELAVRFDRKQFLPSVSDVREFMFMMGEKPGTMKDRSDAFRRLFEALSKLPQDRLETLADRAIHAGPSKLGPLSDAISAAAASLPRHRKTDV